MLTSICNHPSFQAKFVKKNKVQIFDKNDNSYHPRDISILEIEPNKHGDILVVRNRANIWKDENNFAKNIADYLEEIYEGKSLAKREKFYIATLQDEGFENLNPKDVLGMAEITKYEKKGTIMLQCIQVDPKYTDKTKKSEIKGIGRSIIRTLKGEKDVKAIVLTALHSAQGFYEKLGFDLADRETLSYIWHKVKPKQKVSVLKNYRV